MGPGPLAPHAARTWSRPDENTQAALGCVRGASSTTLARAPSIRILTRSKLKIDWCTCSQRAKSAFSRPRERTEVREGATVRWLEVASGHNPTHLGAQTVPHAAAWRRGKESNPGYSNVEQLQIYSPTRCLSGRGISG